MLLITTFVLGAAAVGIELWIEECVEVIRVLDGLTNALFYILFAFGFIGSIGL